LNEGGVNGGYAFSSGGGVEGIVIDDERLTTDAAFLLGIDEEDEGKK